MAESSRMDRMMEMKMRWMLRMGHGSCVIMNATIFAVSRLALLQTMPLAKTATLYRKFGLKFKNREHFDQ